MNSNLTYLKRKTTNWVMSRLSLLFALLTLLPLALIFFYLLSKGVSALNLDFLTHLPKPVGEPGGGMANAIVGTLILVGLACLLGLPIGILAGVYLAEFGHNRFGLLVRFTADVMNGIPSIVMGIFAYTIVVLPMRSFSALAGGVALGIMMIPVVTRTTEELLKLVPVSLREAALALGIPRWKTIVSVVLRTARMGIVTGALVAVGRIAGETAPLLFTAFGNRFWQSGLVQPIAALPLQIFAYAISPFDDWHSQAWAGALVLISLVFLIGLFTRLLLKSKYSLRGGQ